MAMQLNARRSWPSDDDNNGLFLVIIVVGLAVLGAVAWFNFHGAIGAAVITVFHTEVGLAKILTDRFDLADRQMLAADPERVRLVDLYGVANALGMPVRIPVGCVIMVLAVICMVRAAPSRFKRVLDMDGLVSEQAKSFPTTAAFVRRHLGLVAPLPQPRPADYAQTPREWIAARASRKDRSFDAGAARHALVLQLGPRWHGVLQAAPHVRAIFAVFALHLAERRTEAQCLLGVLSEAFANPGRDKPEGPEAPLRLPRSAVARADAVLRDFQFRTAAERIAAGHAYTHTALMSLLNASRLAAGVLAPGQFVWLKLVDRPLWYALHSLGFETEGFGRYLHPNPRIEAAGARDHWAAERVAAQAMIYPDIERAMDAIQKVVAEPKKPASQLETLDDVG